MNCIMKYLINQKLIPNYLTITFIDSYLSATIFDNHLIRMLAFCYVPRMIHTTKC